MRVLSVLLSALLVASTPGVALAADVQGGRRHEAGVPQVAYRRQVFPAGHREGVRAGHTLVFDRAIGTMDYTDALGTTTYEYARWTGPEHRVGFDATELVASWTADTPPGSWLQVEMQGRNATGLTKWYVMGRWAYDDTTIRRTSVPRQGDDNGYVSVDTFVAADGRPIGSYRLRVTLYREAGSRARPQVRTLGAMASAVPDRAEVPVSPGGGAWGIELNVPRRSQNVHEGQYPEYDGGGEAWCSPTSTAMVLGYWGRGPSPRELAWVDPSYADPEVDHAARYVYDYAYEGAGNWPFNTAYAGHYGLDGFVTRLRSLTELEQFIKAGIPVVTSQSFQAEELPGAGYSTNGHLMVIIGFTRTGDVIANDPASPDNDAVRHVYPRANFENVWLRSSGSGGIVYIMTPPGHRLPRHTRGLTPNW